MNKSRDLEKYYYYFEYEKVTNSNDHVGKIIGEIASWFGLKKEQVLKYRKNLRKDFPGRAYWYYKPNVFIAFDRLLNIHAKRL